MMFGTPDMNRRDFLRTTALGAAGLASLSAAPWLRADEASPAGRRPNVVVIYSDDQPFDELGCYGGRVPTPHIDSLARDGMKFTRFYVCSAVCCPSRYNVLSGRFASRSGLFHERCPPGTPVNLGWEPGIAGERHTLPLLMQQAGYRTGFVGKWHQHGVVDEVDVPPQAPPLAVKTQKLLEHNYAQHIKAIKACGFDYADGVYCHNTGNPRVQKPRWLPDPWRVHNQEWITAAAVRFIEQNREQPFFLYMPTTLTHAPSPLESLRKGDPRATPAGYLDEAPDVQPSREDLLERIHKARANRYEAGAMWLDDAVGAVLKTLDDLDLAENTIVIYASDNGKVPGKNTCYDLGAHLPCLIRWPARIKPGTTTDKLAANVDFAATLYDACGVDVPEDAKVDGRSLLPLLTGGDYQRESILLEIGCTRAVVTEDRYKYLALRFEPEIQKQVEQGARYTHNGLKLGEHHHTYKAEKTWNHYFAPDQLYNLKADPKEQRNLAGRADQADRLKRMQGLMTRYSADLPHAFGEFTRNG